jgi:hypothetical protein
VNGRSAFVGVAAVGGFPLVLAACQADHPAQDPPGAPESPRAEVVDSAGVELVDNLDQGLWGPEERAVVEELRIGVVEGEEPYQLFQVSDVTWGPEGRIYVASQLTASVRVFDDEGRFVRELGGRGQGPGEFLDVTRLFPTSDRIWVGDWQQLRVTALTYEGEPLEGWTFIHAGVISLLHKSPQGWLGVAYRADTPRPRRPPAGTPHVTRIFVDRVAPAGDEGNEALSEPVVELPNRVLYATFDGARWDHPLLVPRPSTGFDASGRIFVSPGDGYEVNIYSPEGALERRVRREVTPRPLGPEVASELVALARGHFADPELFTGSPDRGRRQLAEYRERVEWQASLPMPTHVPPVDRIIVGPDGAFWIERIDEVPPARFEYERTFPDARRAPEARRSVPWDVFDVRGHLLGTVRLPTGFRPHRVDGLRVVGVERDEMGVEFVVVYRVVEPGS